jgi:hypothetical protein
MSRQRTLGAALSGELDFFDRAAGLLHSVRDEVENTEWPIEMVFGTDDGITRTESYIFSHREELLKQIDEAVKAIHEASDLYMKILEALP